MDEELCIEITKPKDDTQDLIITVSIARSYVIAGSLEISNQNGDETQVSRDAQMLQSYAM